jgi:hypothetical protein
MPAPRDLYATFLLVTALAAVLAALLLRPGTDLKPLRSRTMELDEPAPRAR